MEWGLLGPEHLAGSRRTRTLELGAAVRQFNQLAVPGLGGVWFAKQLFLATLGVVVAERLRQTNRSVKTIQVANAIEALACWATFQANGHQRDARLRGIRKLAGKTDLTFAKLCRPGFYVTQPMRMATVEPLAGLGFVLSDSQRFNSFRPTLEGIKLVEAATSQYAPHRVTVADYLVRLAIESTTIRMTSQLQRALSPVEPLAPIACDYIRSRICERSGTDVGAARRKNALAWVASISPQKPATWEKRPPAIDDDHWADLRLGALFFRTRDAAIDVLIELESAIGRTDARRITPVEAVGSCAVRKQLTKLRDAARQFLDRHADPTDGQIASDFCRQCVAEDPTEVVKNLVRRDNRVLQQRGGCIVPGSAFVGRPYEDDGDDDGTGPGIENVDGIPVPESISPRIQNLYLLELDLNHRLGGFLRPPAEGDTP